MAKNYRLLRIFYNPPAGTEPFEFECEGLHTFMPPDQYWKKEQEEYVIGYLMHPKLNVPKVDPRTGKPREIKGKRDIWVPDKAKNDAMKEGRLNPPKNFMDITPTMNKILEKAAGDYAKWLRSERDIESEHRRTFDEKRAEQERELKELEAKHEAAKRRTKLALEAAEREANEAEAFLKKSAPSQNKAKSV